MKLHVVAPDALFREIGGKLIAGLRPNFALKADMGLLLLPAIF